MPKKKIEAAYGKSLTLAWGGARYTYSDEALVTLNDAGGEYVNGPALRDALLEAFPLRDEPAVAAKEEPLADWEKELLGVNEPAKPDVVPGMVFRDDWKGEHRVALPGGGYFHIGRAKTYDTPGFPLYDDKVVFDPRGAKALPNPLGIRVGDRVERTNGGVTVSFEVGYIDGVTGHLTPKGGSPLGMSYNPKDFTVTSREVPDRLPAGTIVRPKTAWSDVLITEDGWITLADGRQWKNDEALYETPEDNVRSGTSEVIYLPES